jgi:hypothetical protein
VENTQPRNLGFGTLHMLGFRFAGVFQLRLATDTDPSDEPRGQGGWTYAYGDEPDLDRIIRFNNPVAPRSFAPDVGVNVTDAFSDGQHLNDSIIGQAVNLGPGSYFDGSNGASGHEPIINFEFHVGNNDEYIYCEATNPPSPIAQPHAERNPLPISFEDLLKSRTAELQSSKNAIDQQRLENIRRSLWYIYSEEVTYQGDLDKNVKFNPMDSGLVKSMNERNIDKLSLIADFYGYDGDGLVGYVNGVISTAFR